MWICVKSNCQQSENNWQKTELQIHWDVFGHTELQEQTDTSKTHFSKITADDKNSLCHNWLSVKSKILPHSQFQVSVSSFSSVLFFMTKLYTVQNRSTRNRSFSLFSSLKLSFDPCWPKELDNVCFFLAEKNNDRNSCVDYSIQHVE